MRLNLAFLALVLSGPAFADFQKEDADCAFFEKAGLEGSYWTAHIAKQDSLSPELDAWWQDRALSVYVRDGFVFEAYADVHYNGRSLSLDARDPAGQAYGSGTAFDLRSFDFAGQLSSYRCRPRGEEIQLKNTNLFWFEGQRYTWHSGGNHPDHRQLEMHTENGQLILLIHADNTYGINRQDYTVNLSSNTVHANYEQSGMAKASTDFDLEMGLMRDEYRSIVIELREHVRALAAGRPQDAFVPEPPKPELLPLVDYLSRYIKTNP